LMVSKDLTSGVITPTTTAINTAFQNYFNALYTDKDTVAVKQLTATYTPGSGSTTSTVAVSANATIT
jgi:hypothetical protein